MVGNVLFVWNGALLVEGDSRVIGIISWFFVCLKSKFIVFEPKNLYSSLLLFEIPLDYVQLLNKGATHDGEDVMVSTSAGSAVVFETVLTNGYVPAKRV